jgi:hypothetical protein
MRRILYLLFVAATPALAQSPSIDRSDMPAATTARPVDSLRLSTALPVLPMGTPPLSQRGANQTWNYASLAPVSQTVESYVLLSATAPIYQLSFGILGGVNRATLASPQTLPLPAGLPVPFTDPYQFYNLSAAGAATQELRSVGFGATLTTFQVPVTYATQAQQDVIYRFPLSYASQPDSSNSFFAISVPGTGYLSQKRKRVNRPDAWGTLTTPFGTFQTVRVMTKLIDHDSIAFGPIPGTGFDLPVTREYKWLAKTQHVPVLTITTQELAGQETITRVQYRDQYRRLGLPTASRSAELSQALAAYPNPSAVGSALTLKVPVGSGPLTVSATDLAGRELFRRGFGGSNGSISLDAATFGSFRGVALLTVTSSQGTATRRVVRN